MGIQSTSFPFHSFIFSPVIFCLQLGLHFGCTRIHKSSPFRRTGKLLIDGILISTLEPTSSVAERQHRLMK